MALRMTTAQRHKVAEKIMDWGNLAFFGVALTEAFTTIPLTVIRLTIGATALIGAYLTAYWLMRGGDD